MRVWNWRKNYKIISGILHRQQDNLVHWNTEKACCGNPGYHASCLNIGAINDLHEHRPGKRKKKNIYFANSHSSNGFNKRRLSNDVLKNTPKKMRMQRLICNVTHSRTNTREPIHRGIHDQTAKLQAFQRYGNTQLHADAGFIWRWKLQPRPQWAKFPINGRRSWTTLELYWPSIWSDRHLTSFKETRSVYGRATYPCSSQHRMSGIYSFAFFATANLAPWRRNTKQLQALFPRPKCSIMVPVKTRIMNCEVFIILVYFGKFDGVKERVEQFELKLRRDQLRNSMIMRLRHWKNWVNTRRGIDCLRGVTTQTRPR